MKLCMYCVEYIIYAISQMNEFVVLQNRWITFIAMKNKNIYFTLQDENFTIFVGIHSYIYIYI